MIDPKLLGDMARDHEKNLLTKDEAKAFLKDLTEVCKRHKVFLRTSDQTIRFSKAFADSDIRTVFRGAVDKNGRCSLAKIDMK